MDFREEEEWLGLAPASEGGDVTALFDPSSTMMRQTTQMWADGPAQTKAPVPAGDVDAARLPGSTFDTFCDFEDDLDATDGAPSRKKRSSRGKKSKTRSKRSSSSSSLPKGWQRAQNAEGKDYFYNAETQESRWTAPTSATGGVAGASGDGSDAASGVPAAQPPAAAAALVAEQLQPSAIMVTSALLVTALAQWGAALGTARFAGADYLRFGYGAKQRWSAPAGYAPSHLWSLVQAVACLPVSVISGIVFLRCVSDRRAWPLVLRVQVHFAAAICQAAAATHTCVRFLAPGWEGNAQGGGGLVLAGGCLLLAQLFLLWAAAILVLRGCSRTAVTVTGGEDQAGAAGEVAGGEVAAGETRSLLGRPAAGSNRSETEPGLPGSEWKVCHDETTGKEFYYNEKTHARQWARPKRGTRHRSSGAPRGDGTEQRAPRSAAVKFLCLLGMLLVTTCCVPSHWQKFTRRGLSVYLNSSVKGAEYDRVGQTFAEYAGGHVMFSKNLPELFDFTIPKVRDPASAAVLWEDEVLEGVGLERMNRTKVLEERKAARERFLGGEHEHVKVVLKLFPDVLCFYCAVCAVAATALLSTLFPGVRVFLTARRKGLLGGTVGASAVVLLGVGALCFNASYWYIFHAFDGDTRPPKKSAVERAARTAGQIGNAVLGLLLLPVGKTSIASRALGLWPSNLSWHKGLGYLFVAIVLCHLGLFWRVFVQQGSFPHDVFALPAFFPLPHWRMGQTRVKRGQKPQGEDFTMALIALAALLLFVSMGVLAHWRVRRWKFEVFYFAHLLTAPILIVSVLWHAPSSFYYLAPALILWVLDRAARFRRTAKIQARLQSIVPRGSTNAVELTFRTAAGGALEHLPGQFVYIQIPALSQLEWHPFSLASPPSSDASTLVIANRGANSYSRAGCFTDQLSQLAAKMGAAQQSATALQQLPISVDGPFGSGFDADAVLEGGFTAVVLVAGGFGITPLISIFSALLAERARLPGVDVDLIWCAPHAASFQQHFFSKQFEAVRGDEQFTVSLFATQEKLPAQARGVSPPVPYQCHRPDWRVHLDAARRQVPIGRVLNLVSGPPELVDELSAHALDAGFEFHTFSFEI